MNKLKTIKLYTLSGQIAWYVDYISIKQFFNKGMQTNVYMVQRLSGLRSLVLSEWLRSKSLQAINAGEGVEKREPSYTVGGNAN